MLRVGVIALLVPLASCAIYENQGAANTARSKLIGQTKQQVLACMGPPDARATEGDVEAWAYGAGQGRSVGAVAPVGSAFVMTAGSHSCTVNLTFQNGAVSAVRYRSSGYVDAPDYMCGEVVKACVQ
jgi:outer membrane protein assembly factor BamE (lipoprotein component of BamABCDE complex)